MFFMNFQKCPMACGFKLKKQWKNDITLAHKSWVHCPVWSIEPSWQVSRRRLLPMSLWNNRLLTWSANCIYTTYSQRRRQDRHRETDWVKGKGKTETVIPSSCGRAKERPFHTQRQKLCPEEQCPFPSISPFHRLEIPWLHKEPKFNTEPLEAQEGPLTNIDTRGSFVWETLKERNNCCGCRVHIMSKCGGYALRFVDLKGNVHSRSQSIPFLHRHIVLYLSHYFGNSGRACWAVQQMRRYVIWTRVVCSRLWCQDCVKYAQSPGYRPKGIGNVNWVVHLLPLCFCEIS